MQVKKFSIHLFVFLIIGIILFLILDTIADNYHPIGGFRIREAIKNSKNIEVIAVGNSHSCSIDFNELNLKGYRIAEGGNDIFEVDYQIRSLVPKLHNLKLVLFNISYFTFQNDNAALPDNLAYFDKITFEELSVKHPIIKKYIIPNDYGAYVLVNTDNIGSIEKNKLGKAYLEVKNRIIDRSSIRKELYNSFNNFTWIENDFNNYLNSKLSRLIRRDSWRKIFTSLIKDKSKENNKIFDRYGQGVAQRFFKTLSHDSLCFGAKYNDIPRYQAVQNLSKGNNSKIEEKIYSKIVSIINYLNQKNIKIIFYTPPYYKCFNQYFDKKSIETMRELMLKFKNNYDIEYYNFSHDSIISSDNKLFFNSDHLNKEGARRFSIKLKKKLNLNF